MKIIVISDTHGRSDRVAEVLSRHSRYDALLFLGDGLRDLDTQSLGGLSAVRGNCDVFALGDGFPTERTLVLDGIKIFMTHGHAYSVKSGTERLAAHAASVGADIAMYGHTHVAREQYYPADSELCGVKTEKPLYVFNPGSLGEPRGSEPSFGVIEIRHGQPLLSHGYIS